MSETIDPAILPRRRRTPGSEMERGLVGRSPVLLVVSV